MSQESPIRILIVDDNVDTLNLLVKKFASNGFDVTTATSGHIAFELASSKPFDVVLSDVQMPNGNGVELLKRLIEPEQKLPVFLFTGGLNFNRQFALALGAKELFRKPVNAIQLIEEIKASLK